MRANAALFVICILCAENDSNLSRNVHLYVLLLLVYTFYYYLFIYFTYITNKIRIP